MRFEYYHAGLDGVPKLSVDGTVPNSIHFSHWQGNNTPPSVKADTSTGIALNLVGSPDRNELTEGIELVTNNHFDTDGVLSVWTVLTGEAALPLRDKLVAAAEAGDFSEYTGDQAVRASLVIQGSDQPVPYEGVNSPLARHLAGGRVENEARAYALVLPEVERVLTRTNDYEFLWREAWNDTAAAFESFASGASKVEEHTDVGVSVVTLAPGLYGEAGFKPTRHCAPYTAISHYARGSLYLIITPMAGGWSYRMDYPYYSWAETIVRPPVARRDLAPLVARLNELEGSSSSCCAGGRWVLEDELSRAAKFADRGGVVCASSLAPEIVAEELRPAIGSAAVETESRLMKIG